jgi:hypothetical protein
MKMRATSEAAPLYSNKLWYGSSFPTTGIWPMETPSLFETNPTAYASRTLKCGAMLIVHEGGICALSTRRKEPRRGRKSGSPLDACEYICESSCSYYCSQMENSPRHEQETPGLSHRPAAWISVCFSLSTWQRCLSMHMRLEVWQPDLELVFRDLGSSLSNCPRIHHSRGEACRGRHRH